MKTKLLNLVMLCSMVLLTNNLFSQPGAFNFTNNTNCGVSATVYAYDGTCGNITNCTSTGNNGSFFIAAHSTVDIGAGYTGLGNVWGFVVAGASSDGDVGCNGPNGSVSCEMSSNPVAWLGCSNASLP